MASIKVKNTREHDITINLKNPKNNEVTSVTVPGARMRGEDMVPGEAVADDAMVETARKTSKVVEHYFTSGMLQIDNGEE